MSIPTTLCVQVITAVKCSTGTQHKISGKLNFMANGSKFVTCKTMCCFFSGAPVGPLN